MRLGILSSHPIQYQAPWFRELAKVLDLQVYFAHQTTASEQAQAGFGVGFDWDVDLLTGYAHRFLPNTSRHPGVNHFGGCDTPQIGEAIRGGGFDAFVVTGWYLKSYWQAIRACRGARVPVLVRGDSHLLTPRSWLKRSLKQMVYRRLLRQFDGFLVVGQRHRDYLLHYGAEAGRMFPAPHFVDNRWFAERAAAALAARGEIRRTWGARDETVVVLFVGKLMRLKRPGDILQAMARLPNGSAVAIFVGSGELGAELELEAKRLGVAVQFEGFKNQSELPRYYAAADVLVLASESETWGLVVNEAMACGLPAIVSEAVGCSPDLIEEGITGFTFPVGDTTALAERIRKLSLLRARGHPFQEAVRKKIEDYSVESAVAGTVAAVKALLKSRQN
jgi:glycosyltransferase involved in cell wall biosynthesis